MQLIGIHFAILHALSVVALFQLVDETSRLILSDQANCATTPASTSQPRAQGTEAFGLLYQVVQLRAAALIELSAETVCILTASVSKVVILQASL